MNAATFLCAVAVALGGCKSSSGRAADAAAAPPPLECGELLPEAEVERVCGGAPITRKTATLGEGWTPLPVCDRKFFIDGGGVGFRLHRHADESRSRAHFAQEDARARTLGGYGVGAAGIRFVDVVAGKPTPTLTFLRGAWTGVIYVVAGADGGAPACTFPQMERLARAVTRRLPR